MLAPPSISGKSPTHSMTAYLAKTTAVVLAVLLTAKLFICRAQSAPTLDDLQAQVRALQSQNKDLQEQLAKQQKLLEALNERLQERPSTTSAEHDEPSP